MMFGIFDIFTGALLRGEFYFSVDCVHYIVLDIVYVNRKRIHAIFTCESLLFTLHSQVHVVSPL